MPEMKSLTLNDKTYDSFVDPVARALAFASAMINSASGESLAVSDASDGKLYGLNIYGKTTQDGTPTPDAPVELVSVGDGGSITVSVSGENEGQNMTVATPNGLPGIPVASGGNYTDANGQQWICDEIDLAMGVYVQRIGLKIFKGTETYENHIDSVGFVSSPMAHKDWLPARCTHAPFKDDMVSWANADYVRFKATYFNVDTVSQFRAFVTEQYESGSPMSILYILATPIETPLSEEELAAYAALHTYRENTTVSNDASAHMKLEYVMDAKKYLNSLVASAILPATVE